MSQLLQQRAIKNLVNQIEIDKSLELEDIHEYLTHVLEIREGKNKLHIIEGGYKQ